MSVILPWLPWLPWLMALQPLATPTEPGVHELELERAGDETLLYTLSIPEGFEPGTPRPLVVALEKLDSWNAPSARLVLLSDITHYEVPSFVPHLTDAVDWIREVWDER